jgi:hypothetical protein
MTSLRVYIGKTDIKEARRGSGLNCPVARRLQRMFPKYMVVALYCNVYVYSKDCKLKKHFRYSDSLAKMVQSYDGGKQFKPGHYRFMEEKV